ncbi:MAG: hypothetical protein ABGY41_01505, partial [Candidatus Poribacteria bacterium]
MAAGADHEQRVAVQHHLVRQVGHVALETDVADHRRDRGHGALHERCEGGEAPGVDGDDDLVGVDVALVGAHRHGAALAQD